MDSGPYLLILIIGVVIVLVDGQLIIRNSPSYLRDIYRDAQQARRVSGLVAVFFHLVMFGLVALVASVGLPPDVGIRSVLVRVGVLLLLTAAGHMVAIVALSRLREQRSSAELASAQLEARRRQASTRPTMVDGGTGRWSVASDPASRDARETPADAPES